jgi:hypothetical protein
MSENAIKQGHTYAVKFATMKVDSQKFYTHAVRYTTSGMSVYDVTSIDGKRNNILVYDDNLVPDPNSSISNPGYLTTNYHTLMSKISAADLLNTTASSDPRAFWAVRPVTTADTAMYTDLFDGIRLKIKAPSILAQYNPQKSGWVSGNKDTRINITTSVRETAEIPWTYNVVFTEDTMAYDAANDGLKPLQQNLIRDETYLNVLKAPAIAKSNFSFYVENMNFKDELNTLRNERLAMVFQDLNGNGRYDILEDRVLVGPIGSNGRWIGTAFVIDFLNTASTDELPKPGDVFQLNFDRPFYRTDSLTFTIDTKVNTDAQALKGNMDLIKVVPNPYVATNVMEPAVANKQLNQRRRLLFTHIPEKCTIKIFTASGVLVNEIHAPEDGLVKVITTNKQTNATEELGKYTTGEIHWDMLTREGLEIAAGVYIFHVKNEITGEEKIGKFAVIK